MWQNYFIVGTRALLRNRAFTLINVLGLAIGMAACILLLMFVRYEMSYDSWLPGHDRAFQVQTVANDPENGRVGPQQNSAWVVGRTLAKDFPEIDRVAYAAQARPVIVQDGVPSAGELVRADPAILDILQYPLVKGDPHTAMRDLYSVLLSQSEAARRYPGRNPMGQTLTITLNGHTNDYRVTGVLRDLPKNGHLRIEMMIPFNRNAFNDRPEFYTSFSWESGFNYVRLRPGASAADLEPRMAAWEKRNIPTRDVGGVMMNAGDKVDWHLVPIMQVHLGGAIGGMTPGNTPKALATFALIAVLILAMACINFTNLSTARAGQRAREVALRKVLGASRRQLIVQFLGESLVVATVAMLVALALVELVLPALATFLDADLKLTYVGAGGVLLPMIGLVVVVGVAAGLYPAFVLSRFDPAPVLKSNRSGTDAQGSGRLRSALVVGQFAVSIALIVCTAVVMAQTIYARSINAGYDRAGLLQVDGIGRKQLAPVVESMVTAIAHTPGVLSVGRTSIGVNTTDKDSETARVDGNPRPIDIGTYTVDPGFFQTMGMQPLAGRGFDINNARDNTETPLNDDAATMALVARGANVVINVSAAKKLGYPTPAAAVGKTIHITLAGDKFGLVPVTIVGVVRDVRFRSVRDPDEPIMFTLDRSYLGSMVVRVDPAHAGAVRDRVAATWKRYAAQVPFEAQFVDDIVHKQYDADEARAKIFAAFAGLAILVACLGLYGLAAFTAERRTREIGIRKVLGARNRDIVGLLVWQFSRPVLLANLIAWPIAWWVMRGWLDGFDARIALGPIWFLGAGLLAAAIAAATIIAHALRVARGSPAAALRYE
jgi:putative ABC transport system permease protein